VLARRHDWIVFTSVNGVTALAEHLAGFDPSALPPRVGAVGPATARALVSRGLRVEFVPSAYTTVSLGRELPGPPADVCLVRAEIAGGELEDILRARGFSVERIDAYRTAVIEPDRIAEVLRAGVDGIALTSASIVDAYAPAAGGSGSAAVFCIGPATAAACRAAGIEVAASAPVHTIPGLVATIVESLGSRPATMGST
jgi:uroporphyrinogen III methyltransferase/synthase